MQSRRQTDGVPPSCHVHVERSWPGAEQVIMYRRHRDPTGQYFRHDRVDLILGQDKVAHYHRTVAVWLEGKPTAESECRQQRHTIDCHMQIGARKTVAMHIPRHRCARPS